MFGYVKPDNPNMYVKDVVLYKASYCGLCKSLGCACGQKARMCLSFDLAFLSCFLHNVMNVDMQVEKKRCVLHWFKARPISKPTELSKRIANLNVILAYQKFHDDVLDSGKSKLKKSFFKSSYNKVRKTEPKLCSIIENYYKKLYDYEKSSGDSIVVASEFFGKMLYEVVKVIAEDYFTEDVGTIAFNLGKWIYVADALDDFEKDLKKNEYNPFVMTYKDVLTKKDLIQKNKPDLQFMFGDIISEIMIANSKIKYCFNHDLVDNILTKGIVVKTTQLLEGK